MFVETDFLMALLTDGDWLREPGLDTVEKEDSFHTSILAYADVLVLCSDPNVGYDLDAPGRSPICWQLSLFTQSNMKKRFWRHRISYRYKRETAAVNGGEERVTV